MLEVLLDVFLDSLLDTAKMLPFLFVAYLIIEYIEHSKSGTIEKWLARGGRFGFVTGALLGILPQCGFSAMAANFYASRMITLGTLVAVFITTSDEAIPIMLAQPESYGAMLVLIAVKLVYALLVGFLLDFVFGRVLPAGLRGGYVADRGGPTGAAPEHSGHTHAQGPGGHTHALGDPHHEEEDGIFVSTLKHTASIFLTIFLFTFAFGLLVAFLGEENISAFLASLGAAQPLVAGLLGLVPNCAASVLLTQLYLGGQITFGAALAGLVTNAGIGITVLLRTNRNWKQNLFIVGLLYVLGAALGLAVHLLGIQPM